VTEPNAPPAIDGSGAQWPSYLHADRLWDQQWRDLAQAWSTRDTLLVLIGLACCIAVSIAVAIWATPRPPEAGD
jgi:hypothetical protein